MKHVDLASRLQRFAVQLVDRAIPARGVSELPRIESQVLEELRERIGGKNNPRPQQQHWRPSEKRDRCEALLCIEAGSGVKQGVDHEAVGRQRKRAAIGGGCSELLERDVSAGAALVIHHQRMLQVLLQFLRNGSGSTVSATSSREGNKNADDLVALCAGFKTKSDFTTGRQKYCEVLATKFHEVTLYLHFTGK